MKFLQRLPTEQETQYLLLLDEPELLALSCAALHLLREPPEDVDLSWVQGVIETLGQVKHSRENSAKRLISRLRKAFEQTK